MDYQNKV